MGSALSPDSTSAERCEEHRHAVILAGGRGVRFWPQSRAARPKQLLAPLGGQTLLRRTFERLRMKFPPERIWVVTGLALVDAVARQLPEVPSEQVVGEPVQRNTAPAIGLAAALLRRHDPDAIMAVFPADHHIEDEQAYLALLEPALSAASLDRLIVLGISPQRPETGYGYIEFPAGTRPGGTEPHPVVRFREKPDIDTAKALLATGQFFWNSGQFFWKASVLAEELRLHLPHTWSVLEGIADGSESELPARLAERYGACESVSVDRGILERSDRVSGFAAPDIGWTDLGCWDALHALLPKDADGNCARTQASLLGSAGNYVDVPGKHVALVGVKDMIVVETADALLICPRDESQNIAQITDALGAQDRDDLL